jgi:glycosyltransferase involved in cell wall biosynthesis
MRGEVRHVLMTADAVGGVWTYVLELCRGLAADGIRVTLATMGPLPTSDQLAAAHGIPALQMVSGDFRLEWMDEPWSDVAAAGDWLLDLERRATPDLVHLNGFAHASLPFRAPVLIVGHSCMSSWAAAIPGAIEPAKLAAYSTRIRHGLHRADFVVAPSAVMLASLQHHYGPLARTAVIYNGRSRDRFAPAVKEPLVLTAGRLWDAAKNIEAVAAVAGSLPWPVFVAGEGDGAGMLGSDLHALGRLDEAGMAAWLGRASIFVLPARYEPFGLLPLEAALSGCALVLGDIPSLREVWGSAADYVDPDDRDGLRETVIRTMEPSRRDARARAAWTRAQSYSAASMADAYRGLYTQMSLDSERSGRVTCAS